MRETLPVSIYCPYCKKHTSLTPAPRTVIYNDGILQGITMTTCVWKREEDNTWWIGLCNYCKQPVLVHNDGDIVYPHPLPSPSDERMPEDIRKDLDEAKMCFSVGAYRACAVMARRTIQSSCIDKGASKNNLVNQLQELTDGGIITKDLKDWADVVRWVGNDAAHPGTEKVTQEGAEDILKLAEQFLHVIYVTPAIAKERKAKRKK